MKLKKNAPKFNKKKDYCSKSPDGAFGINWNYACYIHDRQYRNQVIKRQSRFISDLALWKNIIIECWKVRKSSIFWSWRLGFIYFLGVRIGGKGAWQVNT